MCCLGSSDAGDRNTQQPRKVALDLQLELAQAFDRNEHRLVDQRTHGVPSRSAVELIHGDADLFVPAAVGFGNTRVERPDRRLGETGQESLELEPAGLEWRAPRLEFRDLHGAVQADGGATGA